MYLQRIQNIVVGYVNIVVEGFYIEKFINICRKSGIKLGNLKREKTTLIKVSVPVKDFKETAKIAKKSKCKIKIKQKKGIPFILNKYKKRKIFAIALIVMLAMLVILSKFIWNIEIIGNEKISKQEIMQIVNENGLQTGKLKKKIDAKQIVESIRMKRNDISWVGIKISGTNVKIEIVESDIPPQIINKDEYCDIIATEDAMIVKASSQNGTLQVKEGDIVKKGSILISGYLEGKYTGKRYVHATGEVTGKVWYKENVKMYYKQTVETRTGNNEKKYSLGINNFVINFYKKLSKFEIYDTIRTEKKLKISSNFYLPINLIESTNYEVKNEEKTYNKEEIKNKALEEARKKLDEKVNGKDIINEYINTNESEEYLEVELIYEVLENIGTEEKLTL